MTVLFNKKVKGLVGFTFFLLVWGMLSGAAIAAERMAVKASIANLRDGAGTKNKVLWQEEKFHPFLVITKKKDWYDVKDFEGDTA